MRAPAVVVSLLLLSVLGTGCAACRGDRDKCMKAAQHFAELMFWDRENAKIAQLPPEQREAARKQKLVEFQSGLDAQLELRVSHCVAAGADDQADCINNSKTKAEALKCADIAKGPEESHGWCAASGSPASAGVPAVLLALVLGRKRRRRAIRP